MQSDSQHHDATLYQALAWLETHRKQVIYGAVALLAVSLVIFFISWRNREHQQAASAALSKAFSVEILTGEESALKGLQDVAAQFSGTKAAIRAQLMAATELFSGGKYSEAHAAFQKFIQDHPGSPLTGQALLGVASALEAQGKTNEAFAAYENVRARHATENVAPQAKFGMARLNQAQGKLKEALQLYEDLNRESPRSTIGSEAGGLAEDIKSKHPELVPPPIISIPTNPPPAAVVPPVISQPTSAPEMVLPTNPVPKK